MPIAPRMNNPVGPYDFWRDTLQPGLFGLYDRWTEQKPWPTPEQINAAVQNPGLLDREAMAGYAVDMAQPFAAKLGGLLGHMPVPEGGLFGITTWHGSPHKWTRPDISKVGTGEGAQAYGHGFYSAEARKVAQSYADELPYGEDIVIRKKGKEIARGMEVTDDQLTAMKFIEMGRRDAGQFQHNAAYYAKQRADQAAKGLPGAVEPNEKIKQLIDDLADADFSYEKAQGHLYKLDIPDEDVARYLDWDKPLSDQSEEIKSALQPIKEYLIGKPIVEQVKNKIMSDKISGEDLYRMLQAELSLDHGVNVTKAQDIVSDALNIEGISGIRYLDGSSRSAGEGTYNYVTFDPSRITVLERNGEDLRGLFGL